MYLEGEKNQLNVQDFFLILFSEQAIASIATRHFLKLLGADVLCNMISQLKEDPNQVYTVSTRVHADIFAHRRVDLKLLISTRLHG